MSDVYLYKLASQRIGYLSTRQSLIAGNVANANTPSFRAQDLKPFSATLQEAALSMTTTSPMHMTTGAPGVGAPRAVEGDASNATVSGNSVDIEAEMVKLGETSRDYSEATGIQKAFHQMFSQALK